jgi:hypothetical protein
VNHDSGEKYSPTKIDIIRLYIKRIFYWRGSSSPMLSGDSIADLVDFVYKPPKFRRLHRQRIRLQDANSIFVRGIDFDEFISKHHQEIRAELIFISNSDYEFHDQKLLSRLISKKIFVQNSFVSDGQRIKTLPLGVENRRWGINGEKAFFIPNLDFENKINKIMVGPFSNTHPDRKAVVETFKNADGPWDVYEGYYKPRVLAKIARDYRFVACVRGNGADTHRLWETLYRGNFPIVKKDSWSRSLIDLDLPIIYVEEWTTECMHHAIEVGKSLPDFNPRNLESIWVGFWKKYIESQH